MKSMKLVLGFSEDIVEEPITYQLISDFGVKVNILRASIDPGKRGKMCIEISGKKRQIEQGIDYLKQVGVEVASLAKEIQHLTDVCASCRRSTCIPHCPTGALSVDGQSGKFPLMPKNAFYASPVRTYASTGEFMQRNCGRDMAHPSCSIHRA